MSQPSRPRARGPAKRRRADQAGDRRFRWSNAACWRPSLRSFPCRRPSRRPRPRPERDLGTITVAQNTTATNISTSAPITSVAELTPLSSFGGDIVNIAAGSGRGIRQRTCTRSRAAPAVTPMRSTGRA